MKKNLMIGKSRRNIVEEHIHHSDTYQNYTTMLPAIPLYKIHSEGPLFPSVQRVKEAAEIQVRKQSDCSKNQGLKTQLDDQK